MDGHVFHGEAEDNRGGNYKFSFCVPNGLWVAWGDHGHQGSSFIGEEPDGRGAYDESQSASTLIVGPMPQRIVTTDRYSRKYCDGYTDYSRWTSYLLVGTEPFGVIQDRRYWYSRDEGLYFYSARQIVNGHLGHRPVIDRPRFAREVPEKRNNGLPEGTSWRGKPIPARDRRRGKIGWARLSDVADLVGRSGEEVARDFFLFTETYKPGLQVRFAKDRSEIHGQKFSWNSWLTFREEVSLYWLFKEHDPSEIWVRKGFALAVLYLHHYGYQPNAKFLKAA